MILSRVSVGRIVLIAGGLVLSFFIAVVLEVARDEAKSRDSDPGREST